jgi:multidrug efflux pump
VRYPEDQRSLDQLRRLRVNSPSGAIPISNFVTRVPAPRVGTLERVDGERVLEVGADVEAGVLPSDKVAEIRAWLADNELDPAVRVSFKGEDEEQKEAQEFLSQAFVVALFLIAIILVTQFNSFYQTLLILSAVVFSTVGVLLGLLLTDQPFGIVMSGVGVIALAGIVVNNNVVLIDTYNELKKRGLAPYDAVLLTAAQRLRPVLLTTVTTVLGLMPMVLRVNVDLFAREVTFGGPSTDWWAQLASAVAGGLAFATLLTLVLTPALLLLGARASDRLAARRARRAEAPSTGGRQAPAPQPAE